MVNRELVRAFLAYLVSHSGRADREKRARLIERIELEDLVLGDLSYEMLEGTGLEWRYLLRLTRGLRAPSWGEKSKDRRIGHEWLFSDTVARPGVVRYEDHPPLQVLEEYISGALEDQQSVIDLESLEDLMKGTVRSWGLSEVSLHIATCPQCAARAAELRAAEGADAARQAAPHGLRPRITTWGTRRRLAYYLPLAGAVVGLTMLLVSIFSNHALPPQPESLPPLPGYYGHGEIIIPY